MGIIVKIVHRGLHSLECRTALTFPASNTRFKGWFACTYMDMTKTLLGKAIRRAKGSLYYKGQEGIER